MTKNWLTHNKRNTIEDLRNVDMAKLVERALSARDMLKNTLDLILISHYISLPNKRSRKHSTFRNWKKRTDPPCFFETRGISRIFKNQTRINKQVGAFTP
jgi:hypothetical protein